MCQVLGAAAPQGAGTVEKLDIHLEGNELEINWTIKVHRNYLIFCRMCQQMSMH